MPCLIRRSAQIKEFRAEVDIMACMRHVNVVQFVGACTKVSVCPRVSNPLASRMRCVGGAAAVRVSCAPRGTCCGVFYT